LAAKTKGAELRRGGIHGWARNFGGRISAVSLRIIYLQLGRSGERKIPRS
jgi:hypothetical protein